MFNRPQETRVVFDRIRAAKPEILLVISDGPREHVLGEREKNLDVLSIFDAVDWECEVLTNISDVNLGCRRRLQSGLDWVFEQVDYAIILEDDCLPADDFFPYMNTMLHEYKDSDEVGMVSGDNFLWPMRKKSNGYYFSNLPHIWGWGSWARAWRLYEPNADSWCTIDQAALLKKVFPYRIYQKAWREILETIHQVNTWDYQWCFTLWKNNLVSIVPKTNLITNIGLNEGGTHTLHASAHYQNPVGSLKLLQNATRRRVKASKMRDLLELSVMRAHSARIIGVRGVLKKVFTYKPM